MWKGFLREAVNYAYKRNRPSMNEGRKDDRLHEPNWERENCPSEQPRCFQEKELLHLIPIERHEHVGHRVLLSIGKKSQ
jgi:hypothetical protein